MTSTRRLPLQFLCPSWTARELLQIAPKHGHRGPHNTPRWFSNSTPYDKATSKELSLNHRTRPLENRNRAKTSSQPASSLFDELFPDDAQTDQRHKRKTRKLKQLPLFDWRAGSTSHESIGHTTHFGSSKTSDLDALAGLKKDSVFQQARDATTRSRPAVLLISSLSKTLEESDFMRLSPKAEHIEGWSNGLIKVIQARDTHTLAPLSFYYLLFNSAASATSYRENLVRLHALSSTQSFITRSTMPLPTHMALKPGEDMNTLLKSFTLLPSTNRLFVRLLQEPFTPFIQKMVEEGNHTAVKEQQGKGDALLLLELGSGRYSEADIHEALTRSGRKRNLQWKLAGGDRDVEKLNSDGAVVDNDVEEFVEPDTAKQTSRARWRESRFVIAMKDRNEARRLVREWHRAPLPLGRNPPIVNLQTLW